MRSIAAGPFIDGSFRPPDSVQPVIEAATERLLGQGPSATVREIDDAVDASSRALPEWTATSAAGRALFLERFADALEKRAEHTNELSGGL